MNMRLAPDPDLTRVFQIAHDGGRLCLRATPDPDGKRRAFCHALGYAWVESGSEGAAMGTLEALRKRWAGAVTPTHAVEDAELTDFLNESLRGHTATVSLDHYEREGFRAAPPPWEVRQLAPALPHPLPFNPEQVALNAGLRRLIKLETPDEPSCRAAISQAATAGYPTGSVGHTVFAGASPQDLAEGLELERNLAKQHEPSAARRMGELLGYPACCVERFCRAHRRDDISLLAGASRLAPFPVAAHLQSPLCLFSHLPCRLDCQATLALGRQVLGALGSTYAAAWREAAACTVVVDGSGNVWLAEARALEQGLELVDVRSWRQLLPAPSVEHPTPIATGSRLIHTHSSWFLETEAGAKLLPFVASFGDCA